MIDTLHTTLGTPAVGARHNITCRSEQAPFLPRERISLRTTIWSLLLGVAMVCPAFLFLGLFPISLQTQHNNLEIALFPGIAVLLHVLLGPLLEEVVYRGLFLQLARRYMPAWIAIVLSSAVFAVTHIPRGVGTVLVTFPLGCLFAWMVMRSGSLYPGYLCHAVFNYAAMFVVSPMFGISEKVLALAPNTKFPLTEIFPAWWIALSLAVAVTSFLMFAREFGRGATVDDAGTPLAAGVN